MTAKVESEICEPQQSSSKIDESIGEADDRIILDMPPSTETWELKVEEELEEVSPPQIPSETEKITIDGVEYEFKPLKTLPGYSISLPTFKLKNNSTGNILTASNKGSSGYPMFSVKVGGKHVTITVHVIIATEFLGFDKSKGKEIDHIDRNKYNNSPDNLRIVTHSENMMNRNISKRNSLRFVKELPEGEKYRLISYKGIPIVLEYYKVGEEIYKKVSNDKYLWVAKDLQYNSVHINIEGKGKGHKLTINSKELVTEKIE
jgi:hypothetical protein